MSAPEVAVAYISVVPSLRGFGPTLTRQIVGPSNAAGQQAGQAVSTGFERATSSLKSAGTTLTATVTAPVAALGASMITTAGDFQASMNRVKAVSGATGDEFAALENQARELGATTQFSSSQAAEAMGFLAMAGFDANEIMTALPGTLDLAAAGAIELGQAADIASNILSGYGMETEEIGRLNDILAKTFTSTNVNMQMLGESFKYVGPVAMSAGLAIEETSAAIGLLGNAGIQGSEAGTALRGAIARLLAPTAAVEDALLDLGVSVVDSQGQLLPLADILEQLGEAGADTADMMTIFGLEAGPAMQALLTQGSDALRELTGELETSGGTAAEIAAVQMEGFNGAVMGLKSAWEGLLLTVADAGFLDWATQLTEKLTGFVQAAGETDSAMLRIGGAIALAGAAIGPVLSILGFGLSGIGTALGFLLSPVGLTIAAVAGLAAGFAYLYTENEEFRAAVDELARLVGGVVTDVFDSLAELFTTELLPALETLWGTVRDELLPVIGDLATTLVESLKPAFETIADLYTETIIPNTMAVYRAIAENLQPVVRALADHIRDRVVPAAKMLGEKLSDLFDAAKPVIGAVHDLYSWWLQLGAGILGTVIPAVAKLAGPIFSGLMSAVGFVIDVVRIGIDVFKAIVNGVVALGDAASWVWRTILEPVFGFIADAAKVVFTAVVVYFVTPVLAYLKLLGEVFSWLWREAVKPAIDGIGTAAEWLWTSVIKPVFGWISDRAKWLYDNGIKPAFDGIKTAWDATGTALKALRDNVVKPVFQWIRDRAEWLYDKGIKPPFDGIKTAASGISDAFKNMKDAIKEQWEQVKDIAKGPAKFVVDTVYNKGIAALWNKIAGAINGPELGTVDVSGWSTGGVLPGYSPVDNRLAMLRDGEGVLIPSAVQSLGEQFIYRANAMGGRAGELVRGIPGYAGGGIIGSIGNLLSGAIDWARETGAGWLSRGLNTLLDNTLGRMPGADTGFGQLIKGIPAALVDKLTSWVSGREAELGGSGAWQKPLGSPITTAYGVTGPMWSSGRHTGVDFAAPSGTAIRAVADGIVSAIGNGGPYGIHARLSHPGGLQSFYAHMSKVLVSTGQAISAGQTIGRVGSTGNSSGPHLHLEAFRHGSQIDPATLFDAGGWLQPGTQMTRNATGRPEPVLTASQWRDVSTLAQRGATGLQPGDRLVLTVDGRHELEAVIDRRAGSVVDRELTAPARYGRRL